MGTEWLRDGDGIGSGSRDDEQRERRKHQTDRARDGAHPPEPPERKASHDARRHPGEDHSRKRLSLTAGELLQRKGARHVGTDRERGDRAQLIQDPDRGRHRQNAEKPRERNPQSPHPGDYMPVGAQPS